MIGTRTRCIRERAARRSAPSNLCTQRPGFRKDPGLFVFCLQPACALAQTRDRWVAPPSLLGDGESSLTTCRKTTSVLADGSSCTFCGCSSVGRARPRHVSWKVGPRVRDSSSAPLRVCPFTPLPRDMVLAVRDVRDPRPESRAARHHIRRDARVWAQPKWISIALVAQQAEQPPCKRQVARSKRRRGHQNMSCSSSWLRTPGFQSGYAGSNPARDTRARNLRGAHASRVEIGRNDWAAPEPVTGWNFASLTQWPECRPV